MRILRLFLLSLFFLPAGSLFAEQVPDPVALFNSMYGKNIAEVEKSSSKKDDTQLGKRILTEMKNINDQPALLAYAKMKAAELLAKSREGYAQAVETWLSVKETVPEEEKESLIQKAYDIQIKIVKGTNARKENYKKEIMTLVNLAKSLANYSLNKENYKDALKFLKEAEKYLKKISKEEAKDLSAFIKNIQVKERRFKKVKVQLDKIKKDTLDGKANTYLASYYLLEKGNLFRAWPYLKNSDDELLDKFINDMEAALTEGFKITKDGLSLALLPLAKEHPAIFLKWLEEKNFEGKIGLIVSSRDKLQGGKALPMKQIKKAILKELKKIKTRGTQSQALYSRLGKHFTDLTEHVQKLKGLEKDLLKKRIVDFRANAYIALSKAKLKQDLDPKTETKAKLELTIAVGRASTALKLVGGSPEKVTLRTPFRFTVASIAEGGGSGGVYTFDDASFEKFKKEWTIQMVRKSETAKISNAGASLKFAGVDKDAFVLASKKYKWKENIEIAFDLISTKETGSIEFSIRTQKGKQWKWEQRQPKINFYIFKNDFCIIGLFNKQNRINPAPPFGRSIRGIFKKKNSVYFRIIRKESQFKILVDGKIIIDVSFKDADWAKEIMVTGKPILIQISSGTNEKLNFALDNLYIGPPKPIKKLKKKK